MVANPSHKTPHQIKSPTAISNHESIVLAIEKNHGGLSERVSATVPQSAATRISPADWTREDRAHAPAVRSQECEHDLKDRESCPGFYVCQGDDEPV
jgi:hypothetical protein